MRFQIGNSVIEIGDSDANVIASSTTQRFYWRPDDGNSFFSSHRTWDGDYIEHRHPSSAVGHVIFDEPSPALSFNTPYRDFRFAGAVWYDDKAELDREFPEESAWPWRWDANQHTLVPDLGFTLAHNAWRYYASDRAVEQGDVIDEGFKYIEYGRWMLAKTPNLIGVGGLGNDSLYGGTGKDMLFGGDGDDRIVSGLNATIMTGGAGADTFVFGAGTGMDVVRDFEVGMDRLSLPMNDVGAVVDGVQDWAGSALLTLGANHTVLLMGVAAEVMTADLFV